jgi:hypothetical protein
MSGNHPVIFPGSSLSPRIFLLFIRYAPCTDPENMDIEWYPDILVPERMITVIIGPPRIMAEGMDHCCGTIRRFPFLYTCSNYSMVLPLLHRTTFEFSVRRGFTSDQVSTIIGECDATYLIIEHDPSLYEDDRRLVPFVVNKIRGFARDDGTVIVYSQRADPFMRHLIRAAHRVYLYADWKAAIRFHQSKKQKQMQRGCGKFLSRQVRFDAFWGGQGSRNEDYKGEMPGDTCRGEHDREGGKTGGSTEMFQ